MNDRITLEKLISVRMRDGSRFGITSDNNVFKCGENGINKEFFTEKICMRRVVSITVGDSFTDSYIMCDEIGNIYVYTDNKSFKFRHDKFKRINDHLYQLIAHQIIFKCIQGYLLDNKEESVGHIIDINSNIYKLMIKAVDKVIDIDILLLFNNDKDKFETMIHGRADSDNTYTFLAYKNHYISYISIIDDRCEIFDNHKNIYCHPSDNYRYLNSPVKDINGKFYFVTDKSLTEIIIDGDMEIEKMYTSVGIIIIFITKDKKLYYETIRIGYDKLYLPNCRYIDSDVKDVISISELQLCYSKAIPNKIYCTDLSFGNLTITEKDINENYIIKSEKIHSFHENAVNLMDTIFIF